MPKPNGLGAWWFPAPIRNWLTRKSLAFFSESAWENHDVGYARKKPSRAKCDRNFLRAMLRDASQHDKPAKTAILALIFWVCVRVAGGLSYGSKR